MTTGSGGEIPQTGFEKEFGLVPLGDDTAARLDRIETLLGGYLRASFKQYPSVIDNYVTIRDVETLPIPKPAAMTKLLDGFRDPDEVSERLQWESDNPDRNY